jgi:circadian clock protein KaiB
MLLSRRGVGVDGSRVGHDRVGASAPVTPRPRTGSAERARLLVRLYVAGESPNSVAAKKNLRAAIAHLFAGEVTMELVDVLRQPERGLRDGVLVTPTLIRVEPTPERRVIGNLRDRAALLAGLGVAEVGDE